MTTAHSVVCCGLLIPLSSFWFLRKSEQVSSRRQHTVNGISESEEFVLQYFKVRIQDTQVRLEFCCCVFTLLQGIIECSY